MQRSPAASLITGRTHGICSRTPRAASWWPSKASRTAPNMTSTGLAYSSPHHRTGRLPRIAARSAVHRHDWGTRSDAIQEFMIRSSPVRMSAVKLRWWQSSSNDFADQSWTATMR